MSYKWQKSGWPLVWKLLRNCIRKNIFDSPTYARFCWRQHFCQHFYPFFYKIATYDVTWRHVTSSCQIFTKLAGNVSYLDILPVSKYEVIYMSQTKIMSIYACQHLIWGYIGNLLPTPNLTPKKIFLDMQMLEQIATKVFILFYSHY